MAKAGKIFMLCFLLGHASLLSAQEALIITNNKLLVNDIQIEGNDVTRDPVILRELVFAVGDTIAKMELLPALQRSRENLLNLALFNFVHLDIKHLENNRISVILTLTERWYIWPVPILEYADRNFSSFIKNRDWDKINYGAWLKWNNFRGMNELLTAKIRLGYVKEYSLAYSKPNLGKRQRHGFSAGFNMNHQNEVYISTEGNKPVEYKPDDRPAQIRFNTFSKYTYRRQYYTVHSLRFEYFDYLVSDSVAHENTNYLGGGDTRRNYFTLSYLLQYDVRDSKIYPLDGFIVKLRAEQVGLGMIQSFDYSTFRLTGVLMYHQKLANRVYFYNATKARFVYEHYTENVFTPHFMDQALGYHEFLSGYEPYVIDGSDYVISKYNLKLQLIKPTTYTIPFIPMEQFNKVHYALYLNIFADVGYVHNDLPGPTNTMTNSLLYSYGVGFDLVTYYDQVFRIDFAMNRIGEHGFFFHVETPFYRW